ncbi:MAG: PIN domain-containing protein [Actinomycetota bacterium]
MGKVGRAAGYSIFVDSGGWIAVNDPRDKQHKTAGDFYREKAIGSYVELVTTNLVVAETHAALLRAGGREKGLKFLSLMHSSSRVRLIYSTAELEETAAGILVKFKNQDFSLCDAVSFAAMKEMGIRDAFAFDRYFETAGFRRLP